MRRYGKPASSTLGLSFSNSSETPFKERILPSRANFLTVPSRASTATVPPRLRARSSALPRVLRSAFRSNSPVISTPSLLRQWTVFSSCCFCAESCTLPDRASDDDSRRIDLHVDRRGACAALHFAAQLGALPRPSHGRLTYAQDRVVRGQFDALDFHRPAEQPGEIDVLALEIALRRAASGLVAI